MPQIADVMWQAAEQEDKVPTSAEQWVWTVELVAGQTVWIWPGLWECLESWVICQHSTGIHRLETRKSLVGKSNY